MRKITKYSILLFLSIWLIGCKDYLNIIPESEYTFESGYKTQADFVQAIAGIYARQQYLYSTTFVNNQAWMRGIILRADEFQAGAGYVFGLDVCTNDANNAWSTQNWAVFWSIISLSNIVLDKINDGTFVDENMQNYIKGEAYILRGYAYWNLSYQYGGMPLIDKPLTPDEIKKIARSTQQETFKFAEADFKKAIELLPEAWTGANLGRATKYAAMGMLARLYMFQSNFDLAKEQLSNIISSGKYNMEPSYVSCFTDSKDNGLERVWEVQFTGGQLGEGQGFSTGWLPEGFNDKKIMPFTGWACAVRVDDSLYYGYEKGDKRRDISILKGWNNRGVLDTISKWVIKYMHYDAYEPKTQEDWAYNVPIIRYTDVKMMYAEALNEEGYVADGQAFSILNEVRARAGLSPYTSVQLPDKESFREAIIKERRFEFAFEGLRWIDLLRWGIAKEMKNLQFASLQNGFKNGVALYKMEDYHTLFPIPFDEITRYNDESIMWQNPNY